MKRDFYIGIGVVLVIVGVIALAYPFLNGGGPAGRFTGAATANCEETDYGRDPFAYGKIFSSSMPGTVKADADYCRSGVELVEYYCENGYAKSAVVSCSFYSGFCSNGLCVV